MKTYDQIIAKLERFIHKYYVNDLLKGLIMFFAIGLFYLLATLSFEVFFWLNKTGRLVLFWLFVAVEIALFSRFIVYPLLKILKLSKGIGYGEAARLIGKHFPEVNDKLINVLQLKKAGEHGSSDLLAASIDQKSQELQPIPFNIAIDFKGNVKYLKYAVIPVFILLAIWISGKQTLFSDSYSRVVNYKTAYQPPAPFSFEILNKQLKGEENKSYELRIKTTGDLRPTDAKIHIDGEDYVMKGQQPGHFSYTFDALQNDVDFSLSANEVHSPTYHLDVINVPSLEDFDMELHFPKYLGKTNKTIRGTGDATLPEGTEVLWKLKTKHTQHVNLKLPDTLLQFSKKGNHFFLNRRLVNNTSYTISTSNAHVKEYEKLDYRIKVINDQYPKIEVEKKEDTTTRDMLYFHGNLKDDYGLTKLQLVYYPVDDQNDRRVKPISIAHSTVDEFVYAFPDTLELKKGKSYELYFQVFDNDEVNGHKAKKSDHFSYRVLTDGEQEEKKLKSQKQDYEGMQKIFDKMKEGEKNWEEINRMQKENSKLNYNDKQKFNDFLERQKQENKMMKHYSEKMKDNLEDFQKNKKDDAFKKKLKERLERQEKSLKQNEKRQKELEKYRDKINNKELAKKLKKAAKERKNQRRNLEELLELTKRYYVQKEAERLASDLKKLSEKQRDISKKDSANTSRAQSGLNKSFDKFKRDMDSLQSENKHLKKPMEMERDAEGEKAIDKDQNEAMDELKKSESKNGSEEQKSSENQDNTESSEESHNRDSKKRAKQKQKSAGEKMEEMSAQMRQMMQMNSAQQMAEDAEMLRQILDNLIEFSFREEDLMESFKTMDSEDPGFAKGLQEQQALKENFGHVDDSLYSLALRNPMISDKIMGKLSDIDFNINKALERLADNKVNTAVSNQHYVLDNTNQLANLLDDALQNMQMMMQAQSSGGGGGKPMPGQNGQGGRGFQLPDIIKKQESLGQKEGKEGQSKSGQSGKKQGKDGNDGQNGKSAGKNGNKENGQGGKEGRRQGGGQLPNEQMSKQLYEIYKEQQKLRFQLQNVIEHENLKGGQPVIDEMEKVEQKLLEKGYTEQTKQQMINIKQRLIQLKNASYRQRKENQRESKTNRKTYRTSSKKNLEKAKDYFHTTEILNRQHLPLRPVYKQIVQDYFNEGND